MPTAAQTIEHLEAIVALSAGLLVTAGWAIRGEFGHRRHRARSSLRG